MSAVLQTDSGHTTIAFGPQLPEIGSWQWVGRDLAGELESVDRYRTFVFSPDDAALPACDVIVIVKYKPPFDVLSDAAQRSALIYCPVDAYASCADIDADYEYLRLMSRIVLHSPSLTPYFQSYAPVADLDHHVKYAAPLREDFQSEGPLVWTGFRSNLPPLVEWVNAHPLPGELRVLTNLDDAAGCPADRFGFRSDLPVRVESWTPRRHLELMERARAAIDVKGHDFRQRHKPPTKAVDAIASGVPLAMNADSSSTAYFKRLGFDIAVPEDPDRWLSHQYWEQTRQMGEKLRLDYSLSRVAERLQAIIDEVMEERH